MNETSAPPFPPMFGVSWQGMDLKLCHIIPGSVKSIIAWAQPPGMYTRNKQGEPAVDELFSHCLLPVFCNKFGQLVTLVLSNLLQGCFQSDTVVF